MDDIQTKLNLFYPFVTNIPKTVSGSTKQKPPILKCSYINKTFQHNFIFKKNLSITDKHTLII